MLKSPALSIVNSLLKALEAERDYYNAEPYRVDGTIVGNGSQDFTKSYTTYAFKINDVPTQLIDCPGIEGNEEKFRQIINDALKKCHLVCYVAREAKGIETTTLERIKTYLGENVEVLGIQNIPFNPTREYDGEDYDLDMRRRIARDSVSRRNIEKALLSVLPQELYLQTLSIAALPGLCAVACHDEGTTFARPEDFPTNDAVRESIETLCRQQRNFIRHTTSSQLLDSSRILELKNVIESCCANAPIKIKRNAYLRLLQALREVYLIPLKDDEGVLKRIKLKRCKEIDAFADRAKTSLERGLASAVDIRKVQNAIVDATLELFENGADEDFDAMLLKTQIENAVRKITIPDADFGDIDYTKMISDSFSGDRVEDAAIDVLRKAQHEALHAVVADLERMTKEKAKSIEKGLNDAMSSFVDKLIADLKKENDALASNLRDKASVLNRMRGYLPIVDNL